VHGPAIDGPLSGGAFGSISGGEDCVTGRVGQPQTFGDERFTNRGHAAVMLDRVALLHPYHERLTGTYAVPGTFLIGVPGGWPPKYANMPPTWKRRQPVRGFQVAPGRSFNMVLGVTATATGRANSQGMLIYYQSSAASYVTSNHLAMTIEVTKRGCN